MLLFVFFFIAPVLALAQELNFGTPVGDRNSNILKGADPFSKLLRLATLQPLVKNDLNSKPQLILADSINFSADQFLLELRIRQSLFFNDGNPILMQDLQASLGLCFNAIEAPKPEFLVFKRKDRIYAKFDGKMSGINTSKIIDLISDCPVLSKSSLDVFGSDLGEFNLLVGSGPYILNSRHKNRDANLSLGQLGVAWAKTINIRGLRDAEQGLSALRAGTLDLFYTQDAEALSKAREDLTLRIMDCGVYNVVYRNGLIFDCFRSVDLARIRYSEE